MIRSHLRPPTSDRLAQDSTRILHCSIWSPASDALLNSLANHGYIPRTGKNITIPMILNAASDVFNINADTILPFAKFGLLSGDEHVSLTLDALKLHGLLEHDASISRGDIAFGDNLHFNETLFTVLADANPGVDYYNVTSAGQVMHARLADSLANNPNVTSTAKELILHSGFPERARCIWVSWVTLSLVWQRRSEFVQIFFREERLPVAEGWKKSATPITAQNNQALANQILQVANDSPTQMSAHTILLAHNICSGPNVVEAAGREDEGCEVVEVGEDAEQVVLDVGGHGREPCFGLPSCA
ncbi:hypothetical protein B0H13DRAFT_2463949 [Mycena leptocephala]|nr:hypothetical protein B0H13DRAFT_2463949 [Mycena leptocephala]